MAWSVVSIIYRLLWNITSLAKIRHHKQNVPKSKGGQGKLRDSIIDRERVIDLSFSPLWTLGHKSNVIYWVLTYWAAGSATPFWTEAIRFKRPVQPWQRYWPGLHGHSGGEEVKVEASETQATDERGCKKSLCGFPLTDHLTNHNILCWWILMDVRNMSKKVKVYIIIFSLLKYELFRQ